MRVDNCKRHADMTRLPLRMDRRLSDELQPAQGDDTNRFGLLYKGDLSISFFLINSERCVLPAARNMQLCLLRAMRREL